MIKYMYKETKASTVSTALAAPICWYKGVMIRNRQIPNAAAIKYVREYSFFMPRGSIVCSPNTALKDITNGVQQRIRKT